MGKEEESLTQELMISDLRIPPKYPQRPTKPRIAQQQEAPCQCCCFTVRIVCQIVCSLAIIGVMVAVYIVVDSVESDY